MDSLPGSDARVVAGTLLLTELSAEHVEVCDHDVRQTPADGLCFLHAVMQQLRIDDPSIVWQAAMAVTQALATNRNTWKLYIDLDQAAHMERMESLEDFGLGGVLRSRKLCPVDLRSFAYILDRCCGVVSFDWGYPRLYCDHVFMQEFLNWCGGSLLLVTLDKRVSRMCARGLDRPSECVFKMVHYTDSPEHFNAVCPRVWEDHAPLASMRQRILVKLSEFGGCGYWCALSLDPFLIAEEILPELEPESEGNDAESISSDEDVPSVASAAAEPVLPGGVASSGSVAATLPQNRTAGTGRVVPQAMSSSQSPHPRASQERRFAAIAEQWHRWVVVPEFIGGVPTTMDLLDSGVCLPRKHCFWKGCHWTGSDNAARWAHVRSKHWSTVLAEAVAYYHNGLSPNRRLETVMNQVAGLITRQGAPLSCVSIDRRSLNNLWSALAPEDSVESVVCFSCACSHPLVRPLSGSRISYHNAFANGRFLGLVPAKVEEFFGRATFLTKYGRRVVKGAETNLCQSPFREELEAWEVGIWLKQTYKCLIACKEDVRCSSHRRIGKMSGALCSNCQVPICSICADALFGEPPQQPCIALTNDMWTGFSSEFIYSKEVTYLELLYASPCCLGLICFILQDSRAGSTREDRSKRFKKSMFMEPAFHQDYRTAARGNITMWPIPLSDILKEMRRLDEAVVDLPRSVEEVAKVVRVMLKSAGPLPASLIVQATARRAVVVELIEDAQRRGHPSYLHLDMSEVQRKAVERVPMDGVLPELVTELDHDDGLDKVLLQKSSTPHAVAPNAGQVFVGMRPNAVVLEKSGIVERDLALTEAAAWQTLGAKMCGEELVATAGTRMEDTFVYDFLSTAYPFVHKSVLAYPDYGLTATPRSAQNGPKVDLQTFSACMNRRIEQQYRGCWSYNYTLWNINFRDQLNRSRMLYSVALAGDNADGGQVTPEVVSRASMEIVKALKGTYITPDGKRLPVSGDITKAIYASGLSAVARRLLYNVCAISRDIAGTQEIRRRARSITNSMRTAYGLPTFMTLSSDENHNAIMARLVRLLKTDPAFKHSSEDQKRWYGRQEPPLVDWQSKCDGATPTYEDRRSMLTNSALSAADGFQIHTRLAFKFIYGMRVCLRCPNCCLSETGTDFCVDGEGLSTEVEGGSLGRMLTLVGTSEFQKKRDEHIHYQGIVECLHTSCTLYEVADALGHGAAHLIEEYKRYQDQACLQRYLSPDADALRLQAETEETWPAHATNRRLAGLPRYLSMSPGQGADLPELLREGQEWKRKYFADVDSITQARQEHIHPKNADGERRPLAACRTKDKPDECKHGFMKDHLLADHPRLICRGLAEKLSLPSKGRRNAVGSIESSRNSGSINGSVPAISVATGDNNDIKIPYRLPITSQSHDVGCDGTCPKEQPLEDLISAVESSQSAQVGYHCDYSNKRQPVGVAEGKEWGKGHQTLSESCRGESVAYCSRRHAQRIVSDCFGRGVLRTPNETVKLNDALSSNEPTAAEVTAMAPFTTFSGEAFLSLVENRASLKATTLEKGLIWARSRNDNRRETVLLKKIGLLYGYRPVDPDIHYLSPYEFVRYWAVETRKKEHKKSTVNVKCFDALVVPSEVAQHWVLVRRKIPVVPVMHGCPKPKGRRRFAERSARIVLTYFHPWTLLQAQACPHVPHVAHLGGRERGLWTQSCNAWLQGQILTEEVRRLVTNFASVTSVRPQERDVEAGNSQEEVSDVECCVQEEDLEAVLETKTGGRSGEGTVAETTLAFSYAEKFWGADVRAGIRAGPACRLKSLATSTWSVESMTKALRQNKPSKNAHRGALAVAADLRISRAATWSEAETWLETHCTECSQEQRGYIWKWARRVVDETTEAPGSETEPLRWLLHGIPGSGKTMCTRKLVAFFEEVMKWSIGVQFHVCTLQLMLASILGGSTVHHLAGLTPFWKSTVLDSNLDAHLASEPVQSRLLLCRVIFIEEVFMLSAQFTAEVECQIRNGVSETSRYKYVSGGGARPWGGINVGLIGDAYQLDCPEGTPLYKVPAAFLPAIPQSAAVPKGEAQESTLASRGLELMWQCVQGVTELTAPYRCDDAWWNSVLNQIRILQLSDEDHAFLHGHETSVPGSWLNGQAACGNRSCANLRQKWQTMQEQGVSWQSRRRLECAICSMERKSRQRVLPEEAQLHGPPLEHVPCAVPNNDLRYEINKLRSRLFAKAHNVQLLWCTAKDTVTLDALREDPSLPFKKREWLSRHDRQCGDLLGMLPLAPGLKMRLTDHVDRDEQYQMLKGIEVELHSIQLHPEDERLARGSSVYVLQHLPVCVYVYKPGALWTIGDSQAPGVYPIRPKTSAWFLDGSRPCPRLRIQRRQLPLTPAFCVTVHSTQGQDKDPLIVDVKTRRHGSTQTCYVGLSRARTRAGVHIMRPFDKETFQGQTPLGPQYLVKHLQGEEVDWASVQQKLWERLSAMRACNRNEAQLVRVRLCSRCQTEQEFSKTQFRLGSAGVCKSCSTREPGQDSAKTTAQCTECGKTS